MPEQHDDQREELVTIEEAARRFGVTPHTVNVWIRDGKLPVLVMSRRKRWVLWSALSVEMRAIADAHAAAVARERRSPASRGATMRRSRPDTPDGT